MVHIPGKVWDKYSRVGQRERGTYASLVVIYKSFLGIPEARMAWPTCFSFPVTCIEWDHNFETPSLDTNHNLWPKSTIRIVNARLDKDVDQATYRIEMRVTNLQKNQDISRSELCLRNTLIAFSIMSLTRWPPPTPPIQHLLFVIHSSNSMIERNAYPRPIDGIFARLLRV